MTYQDCTDFIRQLTLESAEECHKAGREGCGLVYFPGVEHMAQREIDELIDQVIDNLAGHDRPVKPAVRAALQHMAQVCIRQYLRGAQARQSNA